MEREVLVIYICSVCIFFNPWFNCTFMDHCNDQLFCCSWRGGPFLHSVLHESFNHWRFSVAWFCCSFIVKSLLCIDWPLLATLAIVMCNIADLEFFHMIRIWSVVYSQHGNCSGCCTFSCFFQYFAAFMSFTIISRNQILSDWRKIHCYKYLFMKNNIKCMFLHVSIPFQHLWNFIMLDHVVMSFLTLPTEM